MSDKRKFLTPHDGGVVFAIAVFLPALVSVILAFIINANESFLADMSVRYWVLAFLSQFLMAISFLYISFKKKIDFPTAVGMKNKLKLWQIGATVLLSFALLCFNYPIQNAVSNLLINAGVSSNSTPMPELNNFGVFMLAVLLVAVMPALCEETVYRGFVCNSLSRPGVKLDLQALFLSALLFTFMHQSPFQTVHPLIMGIVMALIYLTTRSLWTTVIFHFVNNFAVLLFGYLTGTGFENFVISNWWWVMLLSLAVILPLLWLFVKNAKQQQESPTEEEVKNFNLSKVKAMPYYMGAGFFCLAMWVMMFVS